MKLYDLLSVTKNDQTILIGKGFDVMSYPKDKDALDKYGWLYSEVTNVSVNSYGQIDVTLLDD